MGARTEALLRRWIWLMLVLLAVGCSPSRSSNSDDDDDGDGTWNVQIVNDSSNTMELIRRRPCPSDDPEDWGEIPLDPGGLEPGESVRTWLPAPGCFALSAEGEGCFADGTTDPMEQDDQVTWTITDEDLTCAG